MLAVGWRAGAVERPAPDAPLVPAAAGPGVYFGEPETHGGPPRDQLREEIVADARAAAAQARAPAPEADARLDWAMTDLARRLRGDDLPDPEALAFLLAHYGLIEPPPHIVCAEAGIGGDETIRGHARQEIAAALRAGSLGRVGVGIERQEDEIFVVAAFQETPLSLQTASLRVAARASRRGSRPATARPSWPSPGPTAACTPSRRRCAAAT